MNKFHSRVFKDLLEKALKAMPVVVVTGARQTGKTTLVHKLLQQKRRYLTLDLIDILEQAKKNPDSLLEDVPVTIDEVQRAPELLLAIKRKVDEQRVKGEILLTGSTNLLLMANVADSLAGRAIYFELPPFSPLEWSTKGNEIDIIESLFENKMDLSLWQSTNSKNDCFEWIIKGGYPSAITAETAEERDLWFSGYVQTYLERDLRQLVDVANLMDFKKMMVLTANRVGRLLNQSGIARDLGMSQPTCHRYFNLLETGYQIANLHNYVSNPTSRIVKSKKVFWTDMGLAAHLAKIHNVEALKKHIDLGFWLEQGVFQTLQTWKSLGLDRNVFYWRTTGKDEVDFILEKGDQLVAIEVKSTEGVHSSDLKTLRKFQEEYETKGKKVRSIMLHFCKEARALGNNAYSLPLNVLFPAV